MSRQSNRVARFSGLALAGAGVSHFTSPKLWEPIVKPVFPRDARRHIYVNGGIETVLGLSFSNRQTRNLAIVGMIGYLAYLGGHGYRRTQAR